MILGLLTRILETYRDPRYSARRIIDAQPSITQICMIAVIPDILANIAVLISSLLRGGRLAEANQTGDELYQPTPADEWLINLSEKLVISLGMLMIVSWLVMFIGRWHGGSGNMRTVFTALAWHSLMTLPLALPIFFIPQDASEIMWLVAFLGMLFTLWILVNFIAEVHGFSSTVSVLVALFAYSFLLAVPILLILSHFGAGNSGV